MSTAGYIHMHRYNSIALQSLVLVTVALLAAGIRYVSFQNMPLLWPRAHLLT